MKKKRVKTKRQQRNKARTIFRKNPRAGANITMHSKI